MMAERSGSFSSSARRIHFRRPLLRTFCLEKIQRFPFSGL